MLLIWRGWGIMVPVITLVFLAAGMAVAEAIFRADARQLNLALAISWAVSGALAGLAIWLFAARIERGAQRVLLDEGTGQRIIIRPSAGSLFFVPTKYWALIVFALLAVLGVSSIIKQLT